MKKILSKIVSKLLCVLKLLVYYLFGKISNGLLFSLAGSVCLAFGFMLHSPVAIALGTAVAVSGLVLSFFRENRYVDAVKEIKNLKREQRNLKESLGLLDGRIGLLQLDLKAAQGENRKLRSMKMVEYSVDGKSQHSAKGKFGPAFSENHTEEIGL